LALFGGFTRGFKVEEIRKAAYCLQEKQDFDVPTLLTACDGDGGRGEGRAWRATHQRGRERAAHGVR
jgi:hypothetical protein